MPVNIPIIPFIPRRAWRGRSAVVALPPTLVAAAYDPTVGAEAVTLTFDRAVDAGAFDGTQLVVDDAAVVGLRYDGAGGATATGAATVRVALVGIGDPTGAGTVLDATAATGIVAADGGAAWAGVTALELPFP